MKANEVAHLYVHRPDSKIEWPYNELTSFNRITNNPGQTQKVTFEVPVKELSYWNDETHKWELESGNIELLVGSSSSDIRLKKEVKIKS